MSGCVRKTVRTLMSSCEWCSSWNRQSIRTPVVRHVRKPICTRHGHQITAIAPQLGTVPILARVSQGTDLLTTSENERVSAVTSGTVSVAFKYGVEEVLAVTAGKERSPLGRAQPFLR